MVFEFVTKPFKYRTLHPIELKLRETLDVIVASNLDLAEYFTDKAVEHAKNMELSTSILPAEEGLYKMNIAYANLRLQKLPEYKRLKRRIER